MNQIQREDYVPPSQSVFESLRSSTAFLCSCHRPWNIHHACGDKCGERINGHPSVVSDKKHKEDRPEIPWCQ